ncbi:MAG: sulfotransferase domain-containing protein [Coleofasciculaceae cyanobacterium]
MGRYCKSYTFCFYSKANSCINLIIELEALLYKTWLDYFYKYYQIATNETKMTILTSKNIDIEIFNDDVFLVSYPKSGRTWVRFLIANYLSGNQCDFLNSYSIIPGIEYNPSQCINLQTPRFIQSHWSFTPEFKKVIFIVRDGRDVAVSYYFHLIKFKIISKDTSFADYLTMFNQGIFDNASPWGNYIETWLKNAPEEFLLIKYEDLKTDVVKELTKIIKFAGLPVNEDAVLEAVNASSFEKMKIHEQSGKLYDELEKTDLSIPHVRQGKVGSYKDYFDDEMLKKFNDYHGSALAKLGYLSQDNLPSSQQVEKLNSLIERNNPEIDVDELMQQVLEEVEKRKPISLLPQTKITAASSLDSGKVSYIEGLLNNADYYSQVPLELPEKFKRFPFNILKPLQKFVLKLYGFIFKKQRVVNSSIIHSLRESLILNQQLISQLNALQSQVNVLQSQLPDLEQRLTTTEAELPILSAQIAIQISALSDRTAATEAQFPVLSDRIVSHANALSDRFTAIDGQITQISDRLKAADERYLRNDTYLKNDLSQQKRLISLFLEEASKRLPEKFDKEQLQKFVNEEEHLLDAFYVAFEDRFRGSREDILNRLKIYLPIIEQAHVATKESSLLDIGCGRGEWLKLLKESGYIAKGLDINRVMLDE